MASGPCVECGAPTAVESGLGLCATCALRGALGLNDSRSGCSGAEAADEERGEEPPGEPFGDFDLLQEIGRGGMGVVYRARQRSLDRIVAIKTMQSGLSGPDYVRRFRIEASAAAGLQHPNIVAIHEVGAWRGRPYIVMDYVAGRSLARRIADAQGRPADVRQIARWGMELADAVQHAHDRGILHRDLKPSNVLIDEQERPRLSDFGLAKRLGDESELTLSGVLGSPSFMPPEQAGGRGKVSRRSDVYGLGAVLYHALTGRPPFSGDAPAEVLHQVIASDPVPPRAIDASIPRDLETICLKCLEKTPSRRYATAGLLAEDLGRFLDGRTIAARPTRAPERAWRWFRRRPLAAAVVVAVAAAAWFGWQAWSSSRQLARESLEKAVDTALEKAWGGNADAARRAIAEAERLGAAPERLSMLRGQIALYALSPKRALAEFEAAAARNPDNVAVQAMLATSLLYSGDYDRYEQVAARLATASPRTAEDYLHLGAALAISDTDTAKPVGLLEEAVRQRPTGVAFAQLALAEGFHALDAGSWPAARNAMAHIDTAFQVLGTAYPSARCIRLHAFHAAMRVCPASECEAVRARAADAVFGPGAATCSLQRAFYFEAVGDDRAEIDEWQKQSKAGARGVYVAYYAAGMLARGRSAEALNVVRPPGDRSDAYAELARAYLLLDVGRHDEAEALVRRWAGSQGSARLPAEGFWLLLGDAGRVSARSRTLITALPTTHPYRGVFQLWAGEITEGALLQAAGSSRVALCNFRFGAGLWALGRGDRDAATSHFRAAVAAGTPIRTEYHWSRAFLARLQSDPAWPARLLQPASSSPRL